MTDPTADDLLAICTANDVRLVRLLYCDNGGVVRGKVVSVEHLAAADGDRGRADGCDAGDELARPAPERWRGWARSARSAWFPTRRRSL